MIADESALRIESETLCEMFQARVQLTPSNAAYRQFDAQNQAWINYSWANIGARVLRWRAALQLEAFTSGARIAVLASNSIEHVCLDQAAMALGCVPVPLHVVDNPENLAYVIADSGASLLLVGSADQWATLAPYLAQWPNLRRVVYLSGSAGSTATDILVGIDEWLARAERPPIRTAASVSVIADTLAAVVYTSGTTGRPKGVMLSHRNVVSNVKAIMAVMTVREDDSFLSFLPLSHTFERTVGYYLPIAAGASVAFARSIPLLMEDLIAIRPTVLVAVPRIYERAYAALQQLVDRHWITRQLFALTVKMGWCRFEHNQGRAARPSMLRQVIFSLLDRLFGTQVRSRFGGCLRAAVTGGAAMSLEVSKPFLALGVPILQGYGMTETAPVISCNTPEDNDPTSVGRVLPGVAVRIGGQNELLSRGDNVMVGYWRRPDETALALEADGWLHTGDQAKLVNGRVYIVGRIKDIIVTSTGEKVAPADIESAIVIDPVFEQVIVLGEKQPFLIALVVLNRDKWAQHAREMGLESGNESDLRSAVTVRWVAQRIRHSLRTFPSYATPRAVSVSLDPWTVANGLITPTLKPKRAAIEARYSEEIAKLYRGH